MVPALSSRVINYRISAASPSDELITLGQILSEVGDYACTVLDSEHLSLARKCASLLKKVVAELMSRCCIQSPGDLYKIPDGQTEATDLTAMTIGELHNLYRRRPVRHQKRAAQGREHMTYYYEGLIVSELQSRSAANRNEQLKIDYCVATYRNELNNMSFIFSCPVKADDDKIYPDRTKNYSPAELAALIRRYSRYRDIIEREILIEYVDYALDMLDCEGSNDDTALLQAVVADLGRQRIIRIPDRAKTAEKKPA